MLPRDAYGYLGIMLGPVFHRYGDGYRLAKLACDVVEKYGFIGSRGRVYAFAGVAAVWTQPIASLDRRSVGRPFASRLRSGDLSFACHALCPYLSPAAIVQNDLLDAVWRESEMALDLARKVKDSRLSRDSDREPATLHRDDAGPDQELLHLQ